MNSTSRWSRMFGKFAAFAGAVVLGGLLAAAPAVAAPPPAAAPAPMFEGWICQNSPIPAGHAVTAVGPGCGNVRVFYVRPAVDGMWSCQSHLGPPAGFVITASGTGCETLNTWFIRLPADNMWICQTHFPFPAGFVIAASQPMASCKGWGWLIRRA